MLLAPVPALFYTLLSKKLAPVGKNSTDISAASATFCISDVVIDDGSKCDTDSKFSLSTHGGASRAGSPRPGGALGQLEGEFFPFADNRHVFFLILMIIIA